MLTKSKIRFLKLKIKQIPCNAVGCHKILYTRAASKKYCMKHGSMAKMGKIAKKNVKKRQKDLNSPIYDTTKVVQKICLKCDKQFDSISRWNRICIPCNTDNLDESISHKKISFHSGNITRGFGEFSDELINYERSIVKRIV